MDDQQILQRIEELQNKRAKIASQSGFGGVIATPKIPGVEITDLDAIRERKRAEAESKLMYPTATEKRDIQEDSKFGNRINNMIALFDRAYPVTRNQTTVGKMAQKSPKFGQSAISDRLIGLESSGRAKFGAYQKAPDDSPDFDDVSEYINQSEGFLTTMAKRAGEQRPTDADVRRFRKAIMGFGKTRDQNEIAKQILAQDAQNMSPREFLLKYTGNQELYG